ncbi:MAG: protein-L-isoaspartate O-methyltransferase [Propionivibrio sp.]|nr:protein-L-isoaspartate O-methyltransferase [Propionivibrio sp.]
MNRDQARFNMIEQQIRPWNVLDTEVLQHLALLRRDDFAPAAHRDLAFADVEIPLLPDARPGQSMLPPRLEARIFQELALRNTDKVLEVGSGSGYMAALLATRAEFVHSVEIDPRLAELARSNLQRAGVVNVFVETGDAVQGWSAKAPYDAIVLSGSTPRLSDTLLRQLKVGGRLIAVVGEAPVMVMQLVTRTGEDSFTTANVLETLLAPLLNAPKRSKFVF